MCKHYDCYYYCPATETCDYCLIAGKLRGCKPTDDCEKYCTHVSQLEVMHPRYYSPRVINKKGIRRMEQVYKDGMKTTVLAELANVSKQEALAWMVKVHPESHIFMHTRAMYTRRSDGDWPMTQNQS